jgi:uncharacterized protein
MKIGGAMKVSMFATIAVLAVWATACGGGGDEGTKGTVGQEDMAIVGELSGGGTEIAFQTGGGGQGMLAGITVVGTGTSHAVPDVAEWSFGVQVEADTAGEALDAAADATGAIIDALRGAGIAKEDLRTEHVSLYPQTTDDGRSVIGYSASSSVHATVRDLGKAGDIVDSAVAAGANTVYGPSLRVSDSRAQYAAAADEAIDDARARAEALADKAGVTLGAPIAIVESGGGYPAPMYDRAAGGAAELDVAIEPGVDEITATLTVTFAIS